MARFISRFKALKTNMDSRFRENDGTNVKYFMQNFGIYFIGDEILSDMR